MGKSLFLHPSSHQQRNLFLSENIESLTRAMIRQIVREVTKGEGSLVDQARIQKLFDNGMNQIDGPNTMDVVAGLRLP
jgi:hypothetical protein